ncbi:radical SAM protein [Pseudomonas sp. P9(2020)]|jgi:radical SAM protein with 4Fe4S-binding SPASM domain|uniref:radical SAM protein n=1 Tax=Pseudomonas sp. P9(2020) TaxID=2763316 RepID=UPI001B3289C4|nr:radical SAM protein [Pseudomonas sp. P9(2020)]MBP5948118.1 radical SAM protein [Pseudomonas sp. P9(2020)]
MTEPVTQFDQMIYVRLIEACNLHCAHCFIPNNPKRMSWEDVEAIPGRVRQFAKPGQVLLFQFHGGEPTLVGVEFLRSVCVYLLTQLDDFAVRFSIQTNLMNYDVRWAALYRDFFNSNVGISWDPEIRLLRKGRPETNAQFEDTFWRHVVELQRDGISPYMVVTVTKPLLQRFRNQRTLIDFMLEKGISQIHFERLTRTGYAISNWDWLGVSNREYSNWLGRFAVSYMRFVKEERQGRQPINISPLDGLIDSVRRLRAGMTGGYGCLSGKCDTRFHTFDQTGYYSACTALTSEVSNRNAVGVAVVEATDLVAARTDRQVSCHDCRFKPVCSSGCMATPKTDESGECAGGFQAFKLLNDCLASSEQSGLIAVAG